LPLARGQKNKGYSMLAVVAKPKEGREQVLIRVVMKPI